MYIYICIYIYLYIYQDLLAEKTLSVTLNDINITRVKFELAAPNLMKSNRITAEEQDKDKLGKLYSEMMSMMSLIN